MFSGLQRPKMTPHQKTQKNPIWKRIFLYFMQKGHFRPLEAGKREIKDFWVPGIMFFAFCGLQRPKRTPLHLTQKNLILKIIFLHFMLRGHIWPLVARKRQRKGFRVHFGSTQYGFSCLPASRGTKWPLIRKHKKTRFWKSLFCILCKKVIFGLWRPENGKIKVFWVPGIRFFAFCGLQRPKRIPLH